MHESEIGMNTSDIMVEIKPEVEVLSPDQFKDGFGFGEGTISFKARQEVIGSEIVASVEEAVASNEILIPVSKDKDGNRIEDDGCGDGRGVSRVFMGPIEKAKSLIRAKVFGGGATMVSAMAIGDGTASGKGLNELFRTTIDTMKDQQIDFGAHTDQHAEGENCGCGAIDKAPDVIANVTKFEPQIVSAINGLGVDTAGLDGIMSNYRGYATEIAGAEYSGKEVADDITNEGKIIKELEDRHYEILMVLNMVEGHTVNQELIRAVSGGEAQVFAVDVWRLQELAMKRFPEDKKAQNDAFLSELVYTLGVSGTLTAGDLPVRVLNQKDISHAA